MSNVKIIGGSAITTAAAINAPQLVTPSPIKLKLEIEFACYSHDANLLTRN